MKKSESKTMIGDQYLELSKIGEGTYGTVYKARNISTNQIVAIKKIKIDEEDEGMPSTALREIAILKELHHPNIVELLDIIYQPDRQKLYLIFEYYESDLKRFIESRKEGLSLYQQKSLLYQLLQGLNHCHMRRIFHRDLKPANILVDNNGQLKIADFGLARAFSVPMQRLTHEVETLWYRAPEILLGVEIYSLPVDVWSVGAIMAELANKASLFQGDSEIGQLFKIFEFFGTPGEEEWPGVTKLPFYKETFPKFAGFKDNCTQLSKLDQEGVNLLLNLLQLDPSKRFSIKEAINHKYFDGLDVVDQY